MICAFCSQVGGFESVCFCLGFRRSWTYRVLDLVLLRVVGPFEEPLPLPSPFVSGLVEEEVDSL